MVHNGYTAFGSTVQIETALHHIIYQRYPHTNQVTCFSMLQWNTFVPTSFTAFFSHELTISGPEMLAQENFFRTALRDIL